MPAPTINDFLVEQAPQIGTDINQKMMSQPTPWITLYKQEMWEDEKSSVQKTFQFDRVMLTDESGANAATTDPVDWADMSTAASDTNNGAYSQAADSTGGIPPADYVAYSQTIRDYNLKHKAIWGPPMNTNNLRDKFVRVQQMNACVKAMAEQEREFWIERKRSEYERVSDNLIVLDSGFNLTGGDYDSYGFPSATGTDSSILTNGFLDSVYEYLNFQGAAEGALGMAENRPVYGLVTSARQSRRLIMADPDIREDFRYSSHNEKLLGPMGQKWTYNGFSHINDDRIRRWEKYHTAASAADDTRNIDDITRDAGNKTAVITISSGFATGTTLNSILGTTYMTRLFPGSQITPSSGTYSGVPLIVVKYLTATTYRVKRADGAVFSANDATDDVYFKAWLRIPQFVMNTAGTKRIPNPDWLAGTWEDSFIFHQDVCCSKVPRPITSVGKAQFDAVNYAGEIKWTNYDDKSDNPDGTIGQFRAVLASGTKPLNPEYGIVLRHLAVPNPDGRVNPGDSLGL